MTDNDHANGLVWITPRYAVNPSAIASIFHGRGGEVLLTLIAGDPLHISERDLTSAGRDLLLPPGNDSHAGNQSRAAATTWHPTVPPTVDRH